jgi:type IV pilus assembly protein PilW
LFLSEYPCSPRRQAAGFTLVEIMVGMVIGMLGLIIMMQVFTLSEGQKRTTTGGGDAQSNGAIALFGLQRDLRQAGFGISDPNLLGCSAVLRAGVTLDGFAPVTINHAGIPAGDPNTDTLLLIYSRTRGSPQGDSIVTQPITGQAGPASSWDVYQMATPSSFTSGDMVIATPQIRQAPCNLSATSVVGANDAATYANNANVVVTTGTGLPGMTNGMLFNLGTAPQVLAYAVRNGNLTLCDYMVNNCGNAANTGNTAIWVPIANNIVSLKAQYGRDTMNGLTPTNTAMDGVVDWYDQVTPYGPSSRPVYAQGTAQPSPPMAGGTAPTYQCAFARISAVRIALVARNANYEKTAVTTTANAPVWAGSFGHIPPNPPTIDDSIGWTADPIDLTANTGLTAPATWRNYRYSVIQTVAPLRNLTWQGVPNGC